MRFASAVTLQGTFGTTVADDCLGLTRAIATLAAGRKTRAAGWRPTWECRGWRGDTDEWGRRGECGMQVGQARRSLRPLTQRYSAAFRSASAVCWAASCVR